MSAAEPVSPPPDFFDRLEAVSMYPGWAKREPAMWPEPKRTYVPAVWSAATARGALDAACAFVSPEFAERRNLILANPIPGNSYPSCATLIAAYQLVLPGEIARSHRHTPNALRFVLDAETGMATIVNGIRVAMAPGDVVLTPQWQWHGHQNFSDAPAFWIDVLDVPFVQKTENIFFQHYPDTLEIASGEDPDSSLRLKAASTMAKARAQGGTTIGGDALPTMQLAMSSVSSLRAIPYRASICNKLLIVADGTFWLDVEPLGRVQLSRGDIAVIPSWTAHSIEGGDADAMLLTISDAPIFAKLGFGDPTSPDGMRTD